MSWKTNTGIFLAAGSGVANLLLSYFKYKQMDVIIRGQNAKPTAVLIREHAEAMSKLTSQKKLKEAGHFNAYTFNDAVLNEQLAKKVINKRLIDLSSGIARW